MTVENVEELDALHRFAHTAGHDLRAPVRHIRAFIGMLLEDEKETLSETAVGYLGRVDQSAVRLHDLIGGLVEYADVRTAQPPFECVDLGPVVDDVLAELCDVIEGAGACVEVNAVPEVYGNRALLQVLFRNLLGNALKYRKPGVAPEIRIVHEVDAQQWQCFVSVVDNGIGFDASLADSVFEPFSRLVNRSDFPGSGIGMATARAIVELHGGAISATGEDGEGAVFTVKLPLATGDRSTN